MGLYRVEWNETFVDEYCYTVDCFIRSSLYQYEVGSENHSQENIKIRDD